MRVAVELVGEEARTVEAADGATYGDLVEAFDVSIHEVSILVDDRPVPEDEPVDPEAEQVRLVRLVRGG